MKGGSEGGAIQGSNLSNPEQQPSLSLPAHCVPLNIQRIKSACAAKEATINEH